MTRYKANRPGDPVRIKAEEWNAVRKHVLNPDLPPSTGSAGARLPHRFVRLLNDQPEMVPAFGVLSITGPVHDPAKYSIQDQAAAGLTNWIELKAGAPTGEENEIIGILQRAASPAHHQPAIVFGPTPAWVHVNDAGHLFARPIPDNVQMLESADSGPARIMYTPTATGLQLLPILLGLTGTSSAAAKELFPAVVYRRTVEETQKDGSTIKVNETYIICPGGRGEEDSMKTVHVLHVEGRKMSTTLFGSLPVAANNFDAVLADNGYGDPMLVCTPGEVDEGSKFPVQRYEFSQDQWFKSDTNHLLAGCPAYLKDGKVIVAGGQTAYFVSGEATQNAMGTWGFTITPFWSIDPIAGTVETRTPLYKTAESFSKPASSNIVNQQKRFLKQNFDGLPFARSGDKIEFLAIGGTELLGYQANAVVSYGMSSTGPVLDCDKPTVTVNGNCETFPDTPLPLGECRAVRIRRRRSGSMMIDCDLLVAIGGRYRAEDGSFIYHEKPWSLDLENKTEGWRNDLFPKIPAPRINAALSDVVRTRERARDEDGKETDEMIEVERVFLIGGRTEKGLTASIEALNLTTNKWETDWPGLDGRVPKSEKEEEMEHE